MPKANVTFADVSVTLKEQSFSLTPIVEFFKRNIHGGYFAAVVAFNKTFNYGAAHHACANDCDFVIQESSLTC